jgi:hypothetical protein
MEQVLYTSYLIDGLDNNERFLEDKNLLSFWICKDVTVLTNNFSAEYGLTGSGIINITPRSGSNETTGEVFFITRPGKSSFAQRLIKPSQEWFCSLQVGAGSGALVKIKLLLFQL